MNIDDKNKESDFSIYEDKEAQDLIDGAETDSEAYQAVLQDMKKDMQDNASGSYVQEDDLEDQPPWEEVNLPYSKGGKLLWPSITAICILAVMAVFLSVLRAMGSFQQDAYYVIGGVAFALLSQAFIITGVRDLVNQKAFKLLRVVTWPYVINAVLWGFISVYGIYSTVRSLITIHKAALEIAEHLPVSPALISFQEAVPALVLAAFAMMQTTIFILLSKELKK